MDLCPLLFAIYLRWTISCRFSFCSINSNSNGGSRDVTTKFEGPEQFRGINVPSVQLSPRPLLLHIYIYIYIPLCSSRTKRLVVSPRTIYIYQPYNTGQHTVNIFTACALHSSWWTHFIFHLKKEKKEERNKKEEAAKAITHCTRDKKKKKINKKKGRETRKRISLQLHIEWELLLLLLCYWKMNKVSSVEK